MFDQLIQYAIISWYGVRRINRTRARPATEHRMVTMNRDRRAGVGKGSRNMSAAVGRIAVRLTAAAVPVAIVCLATPASAHVTVTPSTTVAGAYAVLDVGVPHGCDGSSTIEVTIQMPKEINSVTPTRNPLWTVEKQMVKLDPPVTDSHGNEVSERVASVTYRTDTPLPDGYRDVFELSLQLPEAAGATLVFPTIQRCEQGEAAWIEVPEEGQSGHDLERPAPAVVITAAEKHGSHEPGTPEAAGEVDGKTNTAQAAGGANALGLGALGVGVLGVVLGAAALVGQRRGGRG